MQNEQMLKELSLNIVDGLKTRRNRMVRETTYFQYGCMLIDLVTGGDKGVYGSPAGRIINICGDKSAGKTFVCNEIIANAHWKYGDKFKWMYADCEHGYSFDTEKMYGFDIHTDKSDSPENVEEAYCCIRKFAESLEDDEFGIYVLDSLDGLTSEEQDEIADDRFKAYEKDEKLDKGSYQMGKAKYLSREFFPQLANVLENKNILLIIISQIRDNVGAFSGFDKYTRAGGKALDFYCHMVFWLATAKKIMAKSDGQEAQVGGTNVIKVTKGKVPRPYRKAFYTYYFDYGIDNIASGVDYLFNIRTETGDISTTAANACAWEVDNTKIRVENKTVKKWLEDNKLYDSYRKTLAAGERFKLDTALSYINSNPEIKEKFDEVFAKVMTRESLIQYIIDNNLEDELNRRVEEKWERFEDSIKTNRPGKYARFYANQPESK